MQDVRVVLEQQCNSPPCLPWLMPRGQAAGSSSAVSMQFGLADRHGVLQRSCYIKQEQTAAGPISATWQQDCVQGLNDQL
jgi:hypothetical protein